jgi:DNA-binding LacI/PurR family transcriptional regulator
MSAALTPHQERTIAVAAGCDPRTVRAYLKGKPQRSTTASRIAAALAKHGYPDRNPAPSDDG